MNQDFGVSSGLKVFGMETWEEESERVWVICPSHGMCGMYV